ncbi:acetyltransferase domain protein [Mycobacterium ulcerans str. Harvey]|uniref:Acetyltransferase domain protein n=1 Tax=Mycobacterium ulcerans str. Harvey TaxID=1299332 RepID=A0ABN0QSK3_MYCUL|nr:acetyltransferase domain protein [Mycobacterium ulcerans str. Harvey]
MPGRRLAADLLRIVSTWQLDADPSADRVIAEPDVNNTRMIRALERAGSSAPPTLIYRTSGPR